MHRGQQVRTALLDALEDAYQHDGAWPQRLPDRTGPDLHLLYTPPDKSVSAERLLAAVTVVLHEPIEHSDGAWVGYADGHLEFAPDATTLAACMDQQDIARRAIPIRDRLRQSFSAAATQPAEPSHGTLTIKVIDPDGRPVPGATVGQYCELDDSRPDEPHTAFHPASGKSVQLKTDSGGRATVDLAAVFVNKFARQPVAPLWILDERRGVGALEDVERFEFGGTTVHEIRLQPLCRVGGQVSSIGLWEVGRRIKRTILYASKPGQQITGTFECVFNGPHFELSLPPGQFMLNVYGTDSESAYRFIRIEPGRREMDLQLDLPIERATELFGHPAPELRQIKGWKNGGPLTLADLRGKVVLLDFWGYWCGPCVAAMPQLMKLHDRFHDKGLVIVAVHDDSVASIEEMDQKLATIRRDRWNGRDLPFVVALDGGGKTRIVHSAATMNGATTAAYGIQSFPTTLLIGRDGTLLCEFSPWEKDAAAQIQSVLTTGKPPPDSD